MQRHSGLLYKKGVFTVKEIYTAPEMEITVFAAEDVITDSLPELDDL